MINEIVLREKKNFALSRDAGCDVIMLSHFLWYRKLKKTSVGYWNAKYYDINMIKFNL